MIINNLNKIIATTVVSIAILATSVTPSAAMSKFSYVGPQVQTQTKAPETFTVAKKKVSKKKLKAACKKAGGTFQSESNGVFRCISKTATDGSYYIAECLHPRSCQIIRFDD